MLKQGTRFQFELNCNSIALIDAAEQNQFWFENKCLFIWKCSYRGFCYSSKGCIFTPEIGQVHEGALTVCLRWCLVSVKCVMPCCSCCCCCCCSKFDHWKTTNWTHSSLHTRAMPSWKRNALNVQSMRFQHATKQAVPQAWGCVFRIQNQNITKRQILTKSRNYQKNISCTNTRRSNLRLWNSRGVTI